MKPDSVMPLTGESPGATGATSAHISFQTGFALLQQGQVQPARDILEQLVRQQPGHANALHMLGVIAARLGDHAQAVALFDRSLEINPRNAAAWNNRGISLRALKQHSAAVASYDQALAIRPDDVQAHANRGNALQDLKRFQAAFDSYDKALALQPNRAQTHAGRGNALQNLKRYRDAIDSFDQALALAPDYPFLFGTRLGNKMYICDWQDAASETEELLRKIERQEKAGPPFFILALTSSAALQRQAAATWADDMHRPDASLGPLPKRPRRDKIRIGYYSADFHNHATAFLMAGLFEHHDRSRFELSAFSFGPNPRDDMRRRIAATFDHFIDVRQRSDEDIARLSRQMEIDIAVDLKGFTQDGRAGIFACRAAPVQVNYLGFPGTMAAGYIDYLIADSTLIPPQSRQHYAEKIAYLPHSYQANDDQRRISDRVFTRQELGLPETGFVFCCFNNNFKITPETFDGWMRILQQVEGSVLWLLEETPTAAENLRQQARRRGVGEERLVFASRMPLAEHLARHRAADLFLDTLPYNAHTTASDALWAGLPVLTCTAEAFASRVAASLLNALHLPELITSSPVDYEALAVQLARQPGLLQQLRLKLERHRLSMPLFDTRRFARHIEDAYSQMHERHQAGLPPDHIYVKP